MTDVYCGKNFQKWWHSLREHALKKIQSLRHLPYWQNWSHSREVVLWFLTDPVRYWTWELRSLILQLRFIFWGHAMVHTVRCLSLATEAWPKAGQSKWHLWWTKWKWGRFFSKCFSCLLSLPFQQCCTIIQSSYYRRYVTWKIDIVLIQRT